MTLDEELHAIINDAAYIAAEAAVDAFGTEYPSAAVAWDFLEQLYESEIIPRPTRLPQRMPPEFADLYVCHCHVRVATNAHRD